MPDESVTIGNRTLTLTNPDKVFWNSTGFVKRDLVDYYRAVSEALLPHLKGHPVTLKRYPDGAGSNYFYEKSCPDHRPRWLHTAEVVRKRDGAKMHYCLLDNLSSLVWAANLASIELHISLATAPDIARPRNIVFDLDPGTGRDILDCAGIALRLRDRMEALGLESVAKTSGSKGLQVYVPLNTRGVSFEDTKPFARRIAGELEDQEPALITSNIRKTSREGRVLIDWSQNSEHKTTVCVYSLRATERPSVSTPVTWEEVAGAAGSSDAAALRFGPDQVLDRVRERGDLFAPTLKKRQKAPEPKG